MVNPELSAAMARAKIEEIKRTGADTVITACQQCVRTILTAARKNKIRIGVMDLADLVLRSMKEKTESPSVLVSTMQGPRARLAVPERSE